MEKLHLTHEGWYALAKWERETWLAFELEREKNVTDLMNELNLTKNPHALPAWVDLRNRLI